MKYKKGDMVKRMTGPRSLSHLRGIVVEVRENYESFTNHPPPMFRVLWGNSIQILYSEWYYEEDIMAVG